MDISRIDGTNIINNMKNKISPVEKIAKTSNSTGQNNDSQPITNVVEKEELEKIVSQANEIFNVFEQSVKLIIDEGSVSSFRVKMVDTKTDETIREFPDSQVVEVIENIKDSMGVFVDKEI